MSPAPGIFSNERMKKVYGFQRVGDRRNPDFHLAGGKSSFTRYVWTARPFPSTPAQWNITAWAPTLGVNAHSYRPSLIGNGAAFRRQRFRRLHVWRAFFGLVPNSLRLRRSDIALILS